MQLGIGFRVRRGESPRRTQTEQPVEETPLKAPSKRPLCLIAFTAALACAAAATAAPSQLVVNHTTADFDPDTWVFSNSVDPFVTPAATGSSVVGAGIALDFNGTMTLFANSLTSFAPDVQNGGFSISYAFTPDVGYQITGYELTFSGSYGIESPGSVYADSSAAAFSSTSSGLSAPFSFTRSIAGAALPAVLGSVNASADVDILLVQTGTEIVQIGTTPVEVCSIPGDPSTCTIVDEPVYEERPIFTEQSDYGDAALSLNRLLIVPTVTAVPEPGTYALMLLGVAAIAVMRRRRTG